MTINPIGTENTVTVAGSCPVTCILQKNDGSNNWVTINTAIYTGFAFVTTSTNVCRLTINFTLTNVFWTGTTAPQLTSTRTTY